MSSNYPSQFPSNPPPSSGPSRFCIRIGNDRFGLPLGSTVIGRERTVQVTIIDTLISRRHARILCDGPNATIEDLDSRNGTRLNGVPLAGPHLLRNGDRISIGSYDLVFGLLVPDANGVFELPIGAVHVCPACRGGYLAEAMRCPHCGASKSSPPPSQEIKLEPDTSLARWSLGMLIEMIGKAMLTNRVLDAERLMREVAIVINTQLDDKKALDADELHAVGEAAKWLARAQISPAWTDWLAGVHARIASE